VSVAHSLRWIAEQVFAFLLYVVAPDAVSLF
jgi:hypothetical protein